MCPYEEHADECICGGDFSESFDGVGDTYAIYKSLGLVD